MRYQSCRVGSWLCAILAGGCISPASNVVVAPDVSAGGIRTLALWQFTDGGQYEAAGAVASRAFEAALLRSGRRLIPYTQMAEIVGVEISGREGAALEAGMLTPAVLARLREQTGADAVVLGAVSDSWCDISYIPPCWIEINFQILDSMTGAIMVTGSVSDDAGSLASAAEQAAEKAVEELGTVR